MAVWRNWCRSQPGVYCFQRVSAWRYDSRAYPSAVRSARRGDLPAARRFLEEGVATLRALGRPPSLPYALVGLADVAREQARPAEARALYGEGLALFRAEGDRAGVALALEGDASLAAAQARPERALRLAGGAQALREALGAPPLPDERARLGRGLAPARGALDAAAAVAARGRA